MFAGDQSMVRAMNAITLLLLLLLLLRKHASGQSMIARSR
jgi:hypothetical protein